MIRGLLSAGIAQAFMLVSSGKGVAFQRRLTDGGASTRSTTEACRLRLMGEADASGEHHRGVRVGGRNNLDAV